MPNLDGVSATHQIRQFDQLTPIISMTSNTTEDDCITYLATGMNDILAKPFSKAGLYQMLERYCSHLSRHYMARNAGIPMQLSFDPSSSSLSGNGKRSSEEGQEHPRSPVPPSASLSAFFTELFAQPGATVNLPNSSPRRSETGHDCDSSTCATGATKLGGMVGAPPTIREISSDEFESEPSLKRSRIA